MKYVFFLLMLALTQSAFAQDDPVKWSFSAKSTGNGMYEIHVTASIAKGWHIYGKSKGGNGPLPTTVAINKNPLIEPDGGFVAQGDLRERYEPAFGMEVEYYSNSVDFVQRVKRKGKAKTTITGSVQYMTCNAQKCLPATEQKFSIPIR